MGAKHRTHEKRVEKLMRVEMLIIVPRSASPPTLLIFLNCDWPHLVPAMAAPFFFFSITCQSLPLLGLVGEPDTGDVRLDPKADMQVSGHNIR